MTVRSWLMGAAVALLVVHAERPQAAGSAIAGTVKVTGLASNANVVVYIQQVAGAAPTAGRVETMDQRQMQFIPHVLPVVEGATVKFTNSDPTPHNVFSPDNEKYNLGTWPQGQAKEHAFTRCAKFPCVYTQLCRVHPEMEGYVVVLQNAYYAVTDRNGKYQIPNVPPGSYSLAVWHEKAKAAPRPVTVTAGKPATEDFVLSR